LISDASFLSCVQVIWKITAEADIKDPWMQVRFQRPCISKHKEGTCRSSPITWTSHQRSNE